MEKLTKRLEQEIHKRRFSNGHRYLQMYSTSLVIQEFQVKTTIKYAHRGYK